MASRTGNTGPTQVLTRRPKLDPEAKALSADAITRKISAYPLNIQDALIAYVCKQSHPITGYELHLATSRAVMAAINGK
jgi:hypothetical protein